MCADDGVEIPLSDQFDGAVNVLAHPGMARFDNIDTHLVQQLGNGQFNVAVEKDPGGLFPFP